MPFTVLPASLNALIRSFSLVLLLSVSTFAQDLTFNIVDRNGNPVETYTENGSVSGRPSFLHMVTSVSERYIEWRGSYWLRYDTYLECNPLFCPLGCCPVEIHFSRNNYDSPLPPAVAWFDLINPGSTPEEWALTGDVFNNRGDFDHSGAVDLMDAILALRMLSGAGSDTLYNDVDIDFDLKIGAAEVIYVLQRIAGIR